MTETLPAAQGVGTAVNRHPAVRVPVRRFVTSPLLGAAALTGAAQTVGMDGGRGGVLDQ